MVSNIPVPIITPPNIMALDTRKIVGNIPNTPEVDANSLNAASEVSKWAPPHNTPKNDKSI